MYTVTEQTNRSLWEEFIGKHCVTSFMQSWDFGVFENNTGHEVKRISVSDSNNILAICQIVSINAKKGRFLFVPHGPIFQSSIIPHESYGDKNFKLSKSQKEIIKNIFSEIYKYTIALATSNNCSFIRFNSSLPNNPDILECTKYDNMVFSPIYLTSENASVLQINNKTPQELLQSMRKTTRYSIKKAATSGVVVTQTAKDLFLEEFYKLYTVTTDREGFTGFTKEYLIREFEAFEKENNSIPLVAYIDGVAVAAGLFIKTNNCLFYHQGASSHPKIPAPYLLQWKAIEIAIEKGCKYYNFWGTFIPGRTPKSWAGLSLFKEGFGTTEWSYIPSYDIVTDRTRYFLTYVIEQFIRLKRGV